MPRHTNNTPILDAVTATTTSEPVDVSMRKKMSLQFVCANHTSGNGVFTVLVSNDAVNYVAYNRLITNATKTNTQTDDGVASFTLSSNTSVMAFFPVGDHFRMIKVVCTRTTDGTYSAILQTID